MITSHLTRVTAAVARHYRRVRGAMTDAGYSVTEWAFITAAGGGIATLIYVAIDSTARAKIAQILGLA